MNTRLSAARVLQQVLGEGRSLADALEFEPLAYPQDQALRQELCYGTLRWWGRLRAVLGRLLHKPLKRKDLDIVCLLSLGVYQLLHTRIPLHAVVHETVTVASLLHKPWATGLVNGVLRNVARRKAELLAAVDRDPAARLAHPPWLLARLQKAYPRQWSQICAAANAHPPMTLRVNCAATDRAGYLMQLRATGIAAQPHPLASSAVMLAKPLGVDQLPGFAEGLSSVQDAAAQLAAPLLDCRPGMRVLDACAAPGGKSAHILEVTGGNIELLALDKSQVRMTRLSDTLGRIGLRARTCVADAARPECWWDGKPFDRVLLDAPCSATGVIRRHPDIKWRRTPQDLPCLTRVQYALLEQLWPLLKPHGLLVYATCSILPEENTELIARFVAQRPNASLEPAGYGNSAAHWQLLPGDDDMDGFYYARLRKLH